MSIEINLISKSSEGSKDLRLRKIKTISFLTLFVVGALSLILFLIDYRFSASYVRGQQSELIADLSQYDETASRIFLLNQRLTDISELLSQRKKHHEKAEKIVEKLPTSVAISEFQIDESGVVMSVNSTSLLELNNFLNDILSLSKSKVLGVVILERLTTGASGYTMRVKTN